jgi:hypothetical protein
MFVLNNKSLYLNVSESFSSDNADFIVQYLDITNNCSIGPLEQAEGTISTSGYSVLLDETASIARRDVKFIKLHNKDQVQHSIRFVVSSSAGEHVAFDGTLRSGNTLFYNADGEFVIKDQYGCECSNTPADLSFLDLTDTPNSYTGEDGKYVRVSGTQLVFEDINTGSIASSSYSEFAVTSSYSLFAETSSYSLFAETSSYIEWEDVANKPFSITQSLNVDTGSGNVIDSFPSSDGKCAEWLVCISSGSNLRASSVLATWLSPDVQHTEHSTRDIGQTNKIVLDVQLNGGNVELIANNTGNFNDWEIKVLKTII